MAEDFSENEIHARGQRFWDSLSVDDKLAVAEEYLAKYKNVLPQKAHQDRTLLKASFLKVLQDHSRMMKRLRDLKTAS